MKYEYRGRVYKETLAEFATRCLGGWVVGARMDAALFNDIMPLLTEKDAEIDKMTRTVDKLVSQMRCDDYVHAWPALASLSVK